MRSTKCRKGSPIDHPSLRDCGEKCVENIINRIIFNRKISNPIILLLLSAEYHVIRREIDGIDGPDVIVWIKLNKRLKLND